MQMSVAIGPYDPVETPKPLWGSPGAELSTWTTFQFCFTQRYTLYSYTALHRYTVYNL